jgi:hypothetical protein
MPSLRHRRPFWPRGHINRHGLKILKMHLRRVGRKPTPPPPGTEEGDRCNRDGCEGLLEFAPITGCTCFISPPCRACTETPLVCPECGWEEGDA